MEGASRNAIYDWLYAASLKGDAATSFKSHRIAKTGGQEEQQYFLTSLRTRRVTQAATDRAEWPPMQAKRRCQKKTCLDDQVRRRPLKSANKKGNESAAVIGSQIVYDCEAMGTSWWEVHM